ncbi:hypothetical protein SeLEV6574_g06146, partial [Synchytrium endobioticum]
ILAHSLGGIISFDILSHQPHRTQPKTLDLDFPTLNFTPDYLFLIGSPISAVLVQRGDSFGDYPLPPQTVFENIFHLNDPLAYRVEPLVDTRYKDIPPVLLCRPNATTQDRFTDFQYLKHLLTSIPFPTLPNIPSLPTIPNKTALADAFRTQLLALSELGYAAMPSATPPKADDDDDDANGLGNRDASMCDNPRIKKRRLSTPSPATSHASPSHESQGDVPCHNAARFVRSRSPSPRPLAQLASKYLKRLASASSTSSAAPVPNHVTHGSQRNAPPGVVASVAVDVGSTGTVVTAKATRVESAFTFMSTQVGQLFKRVRSAGSTTPAPFIENLPLGNSSEHERSTPPSSRFLPNRLDYCFSEPMMDSVLHAFFIGIRAHFSYWENKDFHYHLLALMLPEQNQQDPAADPSST